MIDAGACELRKTKQQTKRNIATDGCVGEPPSYCRCSAIELAFSSLDFTAFALQTSVFIVALAVRPAAALGRPGRLARIRAPENAEFFAFLSPTCGAAAKKKIP